MPCRCMQLSVSPPFSHRCLQWMCNSACRRSCIQDAPACTARMADQLRKQAEQLVKEFEACDPSFLQSSSAKIPVRELEDPRKWVALGRITNLPKLLVGTRVTPLSLAEARALYSSCILDTLRSIVSRLQWEQYCSQPEKVAALGSGFAAAIRMLDCIQDLLSGWCRVQPLSATAKSEALSRYRKRGKTTALTTQAGSGPYMTACGAVQVPEHAAMHTRRHPCSGPHSSGRRPGRRARARRRLCARKGCVHPAAGAPGACVPASPCLASGVCGTAAVPSLPPAAAKVCLFL